MKDGDQNVILCRETKTLNNSLIAPEKSEKMLNQKKKQDKPDIRRCQKKEKKKGTSEE